MLAPLVDPRPPLGPGTAIGRYHVVRQLGSGGMGTVWLAEDTQLRRLVALKTVKDPDSSDGRSHERLIKEARAVAALNHPHIADVHDVLDVAGQTMLVLEYVDGETLASRVHRGALPLGQALSFARQIAEALVAAHARGIVHRDLKPANVMIAGDQVKVLDFGLARSLPTDTHTTEEASAAVGFVGTRGYASPEQWIGRPADERSDLFAFGVTVFEMLSGRRPFLHEHDDELEPMVLKADAPRLSSLGIELPAALDDLVASLLARKPFRRPASAQAVLEAILQIQHGSATVMTAPPAARGVALRVVLPLAAVLVIAIGGLLWRFDGSRPSSSDAEKPAVVAVLPLANLSGDVSKDFMAAGMAESLITSLVSLPNLTVLSRAAVAEARARSSETAALAKDLGATYLVEGSVQQAGQRLRVTLNLVRPDRSIAWGDNAEGGLDQIFDLQSRLATGLIGAITVQVPSAGRSRGTTPPTSNAEALSAYWRGRALLERSDVRGNIDGSIAAFSEAVAIDPSFAVAHAALGEAYARKYLATKEPELMSKAIASGSTASKLDPNRAEVRFALAVTLANSGRMDEAVEELTRALVLRPNFDEARTQLGQILARKGEIDQAVTEYRKALALRLSANTYRSLGVSLFSAARYRDAIDAFEHAAVLQPDSNLTYQQLGTAYHQIGDKANALRNYERANSIRPTAQAFSNIGALHHTNGEFDRAVQAYRQAIALRPNSAATHRNLGDAYVKLRRAADARAAFLEAVRLAEVDLSVNPTDARLHAALAVYLAKAGDDRAAQVRLRDALKLAPADVDVLIRAGMVHALAGRSTEALRLVEQAVNGGYSPASVADTDEFESLRNQPRFQSLINLPAKESAR